MPFIEYNELEEQWYLVFSANCRFFLLERLAEESKCEDRDWQFFCWNAAQLRMWMLKLARVLIRYPDDGDDHTLWRGGELANGVSELDAGVRLSLKSVFDDETTLS